MKLLGILFYLGVGAALGVLLVVFFCWWLLKCEDESTYSDNGEES